MPEVVRSIVARFCQFVGTHSRAPRLPTRLPLSVSVPNSWSPGTRRAPVLKGHMRDISRTGLALIVPSLQLANRHLMGGPGRLQISFELPSGPVNLNAAPVRCERVDELSVFSHYLVGAHITEMNRNDRDRFVEYLRTLH
jgi:hypothetical protein